MHREKHQLCQVNLAPAVEHRVSSTPLGMLQDGRFADRTKGMARYQTHEVRIYLLRNQSYEVMPRRPLGYPLRPLEDVFLTTAEGMPNDLVISE